MNKKSVECNTLIIIMNQTYVFIIKKYLLMSLNNYQRI